MFTGIVVRALSLLAAGGGLGLLVNAIRGDGVALSPSGSPGASDATACVAPVAGPGVEVLPVAQAVRVCGDASTLVADARPARRFTEGHVAGAVHLPCAASGSAAARAVERMAGKHTLIVYGDTTDEARPVAEDLRRRVSRPDLRVVVLEGGFPAWNAAGLACSSGPCPDCKEEHR